MSSSLSNAFKNNALGRLMSATNNRYKATLHNGASRPTVATAAYAATGLGELATTATYTTGGSGLTGGIGLGIATISNNTMTWPDKTLTTQAGETLGPIDTVAIWDTTNSNELVAVLDYQASPQTASNGGTLTLDFQAATITVNVS